jgi:hypothetical protein
MKTTFTKLKDYWLTVTVLAVIVCCGIWSESVKGQQQSQVQTAQKPTTAWEYKILPSVAIAKDEQKINELGAQGWELTFVVPTLANGTNYGRSDLYFRRSK